MRLGLLGVVGVARGFPQIVVKAGLLPPVGEDLRVLADEGAEDRQGGAVGRLRFLVAARPRMDPADVVVARGEFGLVTRCGGLLAGQADPDRQGRFVGRPSLLRSPGLDEEDAQVVVGPGLAGLEVDDPGLFAGQAFPDREGRAILRLRVPKLPEAKVEPAAEVVSVSQVGVVLGDLGMLLDEPLAEVDRLAVLLLGLAIPSEPLGEFASVAQAEASMPRYSGTSGCASARARSSSTVRR